MIAVFEHCDVYYQLSKFDESKQVQNTYMPEKAPNSEFRADF